MMRKILLTIGIAGICACLGVLHVQSARAAALEGYVPITMVGPLSAHPGDTITYKVSCVAQESPTNVVITSGPAGSFDLIPSSVTIVAGATSVPFQATLSISATGTVSVIATGDNTSTVRTVIY